MINQSEERDEIHIEDDRTELASDKAIEQPKSQSDNKFKRLRGGKFARDNSSKSTIKVKAMNKEIIDIRAANKTQTSRMYKTSRNNSCNNDHYYGACEGKHGWQKNIGGIQKDNISIASTSAGDSKRLMTFKKSRYDIRPVKQRST